MRNDVPSAEANANQSITFDGQDAEIASGFLMITCAEKFLWRIEAALGAGGAESAGGSTGIPTPRHAPLRDAVPPGGTDEAEETTQVTAASSTADSFPSERVFLVEVEAHAGVFCLARGGADVAWSV